MNSNHIIIGISLLTTAIRCMAHDTEQELANTLNEKEHKLNALGKKITEQEEIVSLLTKRVQTLLQECVEHKKKELDQQNKLKNGPHSEFGKQDIVEIIDLVNKDIKNFMQAFMNSDKREKGMLSNIMEKSFTVDKPSDQALAKLKFYATKIVFEVFFLTRLIQQWEECAAECAHIYDQL